MADIEKLKLMLAAGHPVTGPYSADAVEAAGQANAVNLEEDVETITGQELFEAVVPADYAALPDGHKQLLYALMGMGTIAVFGANTRNALGAMFAGTDTLQALVAMQTRDVSHAQKERAGFVYPGDVENARM